MRVLLVIFLVLTSSAAWAKAPDSSLHPVARPGSVADVQNAGLLDVLRPKSRNRQTRKERRLAKKGAVCGDIDIQGVAVGRVPGKIRGCGVDDAVKVRSVSGVILSQQAVMDCATARALKQWIDQRCETRRRQTWWWYRATARGGALRLPDAQQSQGCPDFGTWQGPGDRYFGVDPARWQRNLGPETLGAWQERPYSQEGPPGRLRAVRYGPWAKCRPISPRSFPFRHGTVSQRHLLPVRLWRANRSRLRGFETA